MLPVFSVETVIDPRLRKSVEQAVGLEELRAGRHILRNAQRQKVGEMIVRKVWAAQVRPPAAPAACLASVVCDQQTTLILTVAEAGVDSEGLVPALLRLGPEWFDPVAEVLSALDLWSGGNEIPFGGYSYSVYVDTAQLRAVVRFGNPRCPRRIALQDALLEVGRLFVTADTGRSVRAFLDRWEAALRHISAPT